MIVVLIHINMMKENFSNPKNVKNKKLYKLSYITWVGSIIKKKIWSQEWNNNNHISLVWFEFDSIIYKKKINDSICLWNPILSNFNFFLSFFFLSQRIWCSLTRAKSTPITMCDYQWHRNLIPKENQTWILPCGHNLFILYHYTNSMSWII